jgi:hypothetical protein
MLGVVVTIIKVSFCSASYGEGGEKRHR